MPRPPDLATREERVLATVKARRASRFKFAEDRLRKIAEARPAFTPEEIDYLATFFRTTAFASEQEAA